MVLSARDDEVAPTLLLISLLSLNQILISQNLLS